MTDDSRPGIVSWGRDEAANENKLDQQQARAAEAVRERYRVRRAQVRGLGKVVLWLRMQIEIRQVEKRVEDDVAPDKGLYLQV